MFSLSSIQSQVHPVGHIASLLSAVRPSINRTPKKRQDPHHEKQNVDEVKDLILLDSFKQALRNCTELNLEELSKCLKRNNLAYLPSIWHQSHVSSDTFFENKHGFSEDSSSLHNSPTYNLHRSFNKIENTSPCVQKRSFKTRSGQTSNLRKTAQKANLFTKLFGIGKKTENVFASSKTDESMKLLLSEKNLTDEIKQKIKVAFYEGYTANNSRAEGKSDKKFSTYLKFGLSICILIAYLTVFFPDVTPRLFHISIKNEINPEDIYVTFDDVKGVNEAKEELLEVVQFLREPQKFSSLGGKLPKGVLLVGPPGTGKTLLARAVAGEANVPFFHASGSEFDEVYVGQGAKRMRNLFSAAKMRAPCVIFIDEIDSVGAKRVNSGLHPFANQTINQLLSEMDGFKKNEGVIVLAATNRVDVLDKALRRPGRFDVEVQVAHPNLEDRTEILKLYLKKIKTGPDVSVEELARNTIGFTGAHLENMANQAALKASTDGAFAVTMEYLNNARDRIMMGAERKNRIPDEEANKITAYHEGGHALVAMFTKHTHPVHKVTIMPRGPSLGHTAFIPEKEHYHRNKAQIMGDLDSLMGGRAAEELIFGSDYVTLGAADDLKKATVLVTQMVKEWGMSDKVGLRTFSDDAEINSSDGLSSATAEVIDSEIKQILNDSYERAKNILRSRKMEHKKLAEALLKYETLDAQDLKSIVGNARS